MRPKIFLSIRGCRRILCAAAAAVAVALPVLAAARPIMLGPANPGAENGPDEWWRGASGGSFLSIDDTDPASGANDFTLGNSAVDGTNSADWRAVIFPLGPAADGAEPITFSFAYELTDKVKAGDNIRVQLRFFDKATNFLGQREYWLGSKSQDSAMTSYKTVTTGNIHAPPKAQVADIRVSVNLYGDRWSSGTGRFDDFSVTTLPGRRWVRLLVITGLGLGLGTAFVVVVVRMCRARR
ncbi:MAG: hypothetical protein WBN75_01650 [Verrucomicrobiia bacterium]